MLLQSYNKYYLPISLSDLLPVKGCLEPLAGFHPSGHPNRGELYWYSLRGERVCHYGLSVDFYRRETRERDISVYMRIVVPTHTRDLKKIGGYYTLGTEYESLKSLCEQGGIPSERLAELETEMLNILEEFLLRF